jgi:septum formation protein
MKLILASGSEWRERLISWLQEPYEVVVSGVDEEQYLLDDPEELVATLAVAKARAVVGKLREGAVDEREGRTVVVGADTVIVLDGEILGKPLDEAAARKMIHTLQGRSHLVLTGLSVIDLDSEELQVAVETSTVWFRDMSEKQVEEYLKTNEWEGKAGGYQILKAIDPYVEKVEGSITNVIGLPMGVLVDMLDEWGISVGTDVAAVIKRETGYTE